MRDERKIVARAENFKVELEQIRVGRLLLRHKQLHGEAKSSEDFAGAWRGVPGRASVAWAARQHTGLLGCGTGDRDWLA